MRIAAFVMSLLLFALSPSGQALAAGKITHAMSMKVFKAITEANELAELGQVEEAIVVLTELQQKRLSHYERAQSWYVIGTLHYKLEKDEEALQAFTKVLDGTGNIPIFLEVNTLRTLVQLHLIREELEQARDYGVLMVSKSELPSETDYTLLAQVYYKLSDFNNAIAAVKEARKLAETAQKAPAENLLILQNAIYFEMNDTQNMIATLDTLVKHYPKATYLLYLAAVYGQIEEAEKQTVIMESLYENEHLLRPSELTNLASLYMSVNVPFKAATLLEQAIAEDKVEASIRHYEMLSQAWQLAAEIQNAVDALDKAAQLSDDGELDLRKAYMEYHLLQWQAAIDSASTALDKGIENKQQQGEAWLLQGMALFGQSKYDQAILACQRAAEYKDSKSTAQQWISFISSEKAKIESMQAM